MVSLSTARTTPAANGADSNEVIVRRGDTLLGIANRHGVTLDALLAVNRNIRNPDLIRPGQAIRLPGSPASHPSSTTAGEPVTPGTLVTASRATAYRGGRAIGEIELTRIDGKLVEKRTAAAFLRMRGAARDDGVDLRIVSGFRTMEKQRELYDGWVRRRPGFNPAARPGHSNHQSGTALDLNTSGRSRSVGTGAVYNWLAENGARFGFTRIPIEHWHWEYNGR